MQPEKLFIVLSYLGKGGAERQMIEFIRTAHPAHADCRVVCLTEAGELADEVRALGVPVTVLGFRRPNYHKAVAQLARLLRREKPDAVYALLWDQYCVALPLARMVWPRAIRVGGRRSLPDLDIIPVPGARRLRLVADRFSDAVIANSQAVSDASLADDPRLDGRLHVVPNGIRLPDVVPEPREPGTLRLVCVANLTAHKGHVVLVEALARLAERADWRADFVGEGPERPAIEQRLRELGLTARVRLHGDVAYDGVHALVAGSDIAVLPSFTEGLPNAVLEAMGRGIVVVATAVGGTPSLLSSGAGTLVPAQDPEALADAIGALLDDPERRATAGALGKRIVAERFSPDAMRDATLDVIRGARRRRQPSDARRGSAG